jgi:hypothetical protein
MMSSPPRVIRSLVVLAVGTVLLLLAPGCDSRLEKINDPPTSATQDEVQPQWELANAQLRAAGDRFETWRTNLILSSTIVQHNATLAAYWVGDKYLHAQSYTGSLYGSRAGYGSAVKHIVDVIARTDPEGESGEETTNINGIARITRVVILQRLTDMYGSVPYSEAGKAFTEGITQPAFDPQEEIYADMLNELTEARDQLDASLPTPNQGDVIFGGNVDKWKRFANSMMLRLALRHVKADEEKARTWAQNAINHSAGLMQSNEDAAYIDHEDPGRAINFNANGMVFSFVAPAPPYLSQRFVGWMNERDDPRVSVYGDSDNDPPRGLPNGYDNDGDNPIQDHSSWIECEVGPGEEGGPQPDPCGTDTYTLLGDAVDDQDDPMFFQTYAESELMHAEAIVRGYVSGNAESHFEEGVRAALDYLSLYGEGGSIERSAVEEYVDGLDFGSSPRERLRHINNQYWAATFMNDWEAFTNWRRSGWPDLETSPVDMETGYPGNDTGGAFMRRLEYPNGPANSNTENFNEAIERQGPDSYTTRIWWDAEPSNTSAIIGPDG